MSVTATIVFVYIITQTDRNTNERDSCHSCSLRRLVYRVVYHLAVIAYMLPAIEPYLSVFTGAGGMPRAFARGIRPGILLLLSYMCVASQYHMPRAFASVPLCVSTSVAAKGCLVTTVSVE